MVHIAEPEPHPLFEIVEGDDLRILTVALRPTKLAGVIFRFRIGLWL